ncbi:unnamed protein product, partial [Allacma fusca]
TTLNPPDLGIISLMGRVLLEVTTLLTAVAGEFLDDARVTAMFETCCKAYQMINSGIEFALVQEKVDGAAIKTWRDLLINVREQCHLLSKCVSQRQLLLIGQCIGLTTICSFFISNVTWSEEIYRQMLPLWIYMCFSNFVRIFRKAIVAERITIAENEVITRIASAKLQTADFEALHEAYDISLIYLTHLL